MQSAWKVGALVTVFIALLLGCYAILERSVFAKPVDTYYVSFEDAGGLSGGAKVLLAGVKIGTVKSVELVDGAHARAIIAIEKPYRIPRDCKAILPSSLLSFGDRRIELVSAGSTSAFLEPGATMKGSLQSPIDSMIPNSQATVAELTNTLKSVQKLMSDKELKEGLTKLLASSEKTIDKFGTLAGTMDGIMVKNAPRVNSLMVSMDKSLQNLEAVSVKVRELAEDGQLKGKTTALLDNLNEAVSGGKALMAELTNVVKDPKLRGSMEEILANTKTMTESGTKIASKFETISGNGIEISAQTVELLKKANTLADDLKDLMKEAKGAVSKIKNPDKIFPDVQLEADVSRQTRPGHTRTDINMRVPFGHETYLLGLYDAFEGNKLNLQMVKTFNPRLDLRYGVYASKPGIGVDYRLAPNLWVRSDAFGLNETQFDLRARYEFGNGLSGWIGLERIFQDNSPAIGIGFRR